MAVTLISARQVMLSIPGPAKVAHLEEKLDAVRIEPSTAQIQQLEGGPS